MQLHAAGIRTGDAERILSGGEYWQRQKTLLTEREVSFMKGLFQNCGYEAVVSVSAGTGRGYRPAEREYPAHDHASGGSYSGWCLSGMLMWLSLSGVRSVLLQQ
ncbi:w0003 [Escherichia coli]|nr:w0003 [Escherichia coli]